MKIDRVSFLHKTNCPTKMNMNMIAQDLYRSIIEYLSIADLRDLSKASAVFDVEICNMGIKIFYADFGYGPCWHELCGIHTIIVDELGKKHLLADLGEHYEHVNTDNVVHKEDIRYYIGLDDSIGCGQFYDSKNDIGAFLGLTKTILCPNLRATVTDAEYYSRLNIMIGPLSKFSHICVETKMVLYYDRNNLHVGKFTILFASGQWSYR